MRPHLAPASTAMLLSVKRPGMGRASMPGPPNSSALYVAPSAPRVPISVSMMSLASTPSRSAPETAMRNVSGTRSHVLPLAMPTATSVLPMPVAKAPEGAGHAGVRVGADDEVAGLGEALGDALVTHAHLDVAERGAGRRAEGPDRLLRVGQLAARRRRRVVDEEHTGRRLDGGHAELLDLLDGEGARAVLGDGHVDVADDDLPGHDHVETGVRGEELLGQGERRHAGRSGRPGAASPLALLPMGTASPRRPR